VDAGGLDRADVLGEDRVVEAVEDAAEDAGEGVAGEGAGDISAGELLAGDLGECADTGDGLGEQEHHDHGHGDHADDREFRAAEVERGDHGEQRLVADTREVQQAGGPAQQDAGDRGDEQGRVGDHATGQGAEPEGDDDHDGGDTDVQRSGVAVRALVAEDQSTRNTDE